MNKRIKKMYKSLKSRLENELKEIEKSGRFKKEREILSKQNSLIKTNKSEVINFCANNYLGLASNDKIIQAAKKKGITQPTTISTTIGKTFDNVTS